MINDVHQMQQELRELNIKSDLVVIKYKGQNYSCKKINPNHYFMKVFRVQVREIIKNKELSKNARMFIGTLESFLYFPTNSVIIDGKNPTPQELMNLLDIGKSKYYEVIKELEDKEIIKVIKRNGDTIIFFNPFLFSAGAVVDRETFEMFKNSRFSTYK